MFFFFPSSDFPTSSLFFNDILFFFSLKNNFAVFSSNDFAMPTLQGSNKEQGNNRYKTPYTVLGTK